MPLIEEIEPSVEPAAAGKPPSLAKKPESKRTELLDLADVDLSIRGCHSYQQDTDSESFLEGSAELDVEDCNAFSIFGSTQPKAQRKMLIEELETKEKCDFSSTEDTERSLQTSKDDHYFQSAEAANVSELSESGATIKSTGSLIIEDVTSRATEVSKARLASGEPDEVGSDSNQDTIGIRSSVELFGAVTRQEESVVCDGEGEVKKQRREVKPRRQLTEDELKRYPRLV